jgi:hypothetical protein
VRAAGGEGATALIVRPTTDNAHSVVPPATRANTRADRKDTRNGSVMSFPAIAGVLPRRAETIHETVS